MVISTFFSPQVMVAHGYFNFNELLLISKSQKREICFLFAANSDGNLGLKTTSTNFV